MKKDSNYLKFFENHSEKEAKQIKKTSLFASIAYAATVVAIIGVIIAFVVIH